MATAGLNKVHYLDEGQDPIDELSSGLAAITLQLSVFSLLSYHNTYSFMP
jgi:hypothetical protein